ncbi:hypothetical protein [Saccharibacillus kuerlensis]|uniref:DUF2325 domain-containing protein n=1 Tax=Saccharibacillus kuerlensis TaxID=459527 RepID=A0ABQ2KX08_9BACL|nr:hypothetical protein [Saccharibacillus kuerlensis]GGN95725.1 hypothetical protein GCM10010969_11890 [Saccharibacillus kuerlensis]
MKRIKPSVPTKLPLVPPVGNHDSTLSVEALSEDQISAVPLQFVAPLLREMNEPSKRRMAQALEFPFARRSLAKWPEALFAKSMLDLTTRGRNSLEIRRKLAAAILLEIRRTVLDAEDSSFSLESFDENPDAWIVRYGKWHCYWALYFCTSIADEKIDAEADHQRLERLVLHEDGQLREKDLYSRNMQERQPAAGNRSEAAEQRRIEKLNKRIEALEERCRREEERARRAEKETAEAHRESAKLREHADRIEQELEAERRLSSRMTEEREAAASRLSELKRQHKQERSSLEAELTEVRRSAKAVEHSLRTEIASLAGEKMTAHEHDSSESRAESAESESKSADSTIRRFDALLRHDLRISGAALPGSEEPGDLEARTHLRRTLDLLDAVDMYAAGRRLLNANPAALPDEASNVVMPVEESKTESSSRMTETTGPSNRDISANPEPGQAGTFYRRDHGGYIVLEDGDTFNITESIVYKLQLQHEAEVWCAPREDEYSGTQYEIELLFQGDDTYSPIRQYNGYVELDEQGTGYAVDMNNANRRYPIHPRDLDIQRPADGSPCIFNVGEEESVARLARVYRDFSDPEAAPRRESSSFRPSSSSSSKLKREGRKAKPEPFLKGCTVVVLGGQRKWFEEVVAESGADYVHENGERPDLVASSLRRAQALFLLITSTSHRASWEGVELAKTSGIPYFIIQGSKSNLRTMLWENREAILQANRSEVT